jgi:hypothetical protein
MVLKLAFTEEGKSLKRTCSMCLHNKAGREREREREREETPLPWNSKPFIQL